MSVLDMVSGTLPPTKTYVRRDYVWFPADFAAFKDGRIGSLTLVMQASRRPGARVETDTYGVDEEPNAGCPSGVRSFLLVNDTDAGQPDVYRCVVGSDAGGLVFDKCTCKAGLCKLICKHADALNHLIAEGVL